MHVCFSSIYHLVFDEAPVLSCMQQKRKIIYNLFFFHFDHGDETAVKVTFARNTLRTVPTIVIAHTFYISRDIFEFPCSLIQGYFCAV